MDISLPDINLWFIVLILIAFWLYFFVYSQLHNHAYPWGFVLVILGVRLAGLEVGILINQVKIIIVDLPFLLGLIGVIWNINNIREQIHIKSMKELLCYGGMGFVFGLLFGIPVMIALGMEHYQDFAQFNSIQLVTISILASIGEELLFRGYFFGYLRKNGFNPALAIVLQAFVFAAGHIPANPGNWAALSLIFLMGVTAAYITWKSNKLISALILHIVGNLIPVIWWLATT